MIAGWRTDNAFQAQCEAVKQVSGTKSGINSERDVDSIKHNA